jgi:hypothetical protein
MFERNLNTSLAIITVLVAIIGLIFSFTKYAEVGIVMLILGITTLSVVSLRSDATGVTTFSCDPTIGFCNQDVSGTLSLQQCSDTCKKASLKKTKEGFCEVGCDALIGV